MVKTCSKCHAEREPSAFSADRRNSDGLQSQCKVCRAAQQKAYAKTPRGRKVEKECWERNYERVNAQRREKYLVKVGGTLQRTADTPEKKRQRGRDGYFKHKEYYTRKNARWVRENATANRTRRARYRARKLQADGTFTVSEWLNLLEYYGNSCLACGSKDRIEPDHVVPLSKGGQNLIGNIQPLCRSCNASKRDNIIDYRPGFMEVG